MGLDDDEAPARFTQVHCRFQVIGYIGGKPELAETFPRRADAERYAAKATGPRGYERCEVRDTMAHKQRQSDDPHADPIEPTSAGVEWCDTCETVHAIEPRACQS